MLCDTGVSAKITIIDDTTIVDKMSNHTVHRGIIGIVDSYGSLEFYMEQPSYDIWIKEDNGKDCLCKHVPEKDIVQVHNKSN